MDDEEQKGEEKEQQNKSDNFFNKNKEKMKEKSEKAEKAEKAKKVITIFLKLPLPIKIIVIIILVIFLVLFLTAGIYLLDMVDNSSLTTSKQQSFGSGTEYSGEYMQINTTDNCWNFNIENIKKQLKEEGVNTKGLTDDEVIIELLKLNGFDSESFTSDELSLIPYLLKAEIATQYMDLRKKDDMYDSSGNYIPVSDRDIEKNDRNNNLNGTVHLKRVNTQDNSTTVLEYIDYTTFSSYITGNDYNNAKNYFSFNDDQKLVVATYKYSETTNEFKDGYVNNPKTSADMPNQSTTTVDELQIDYQSLVSKYTLPFEVLTALMVNSEDTDFVQKVANLAFQSNIEVALFEQYNKTTTVTTTNYYETDRVYQWINLFASVNGSTYNENKYIFLNGNNDTSNDDSADLIEDWKVPTPDTTYTGSPENGIDCTYREKKYSNDKPSYTIIQTVVNESYSYLYGITSADTWFAKFSKDYTIDSKTETSDSEGEVVTGNFTKYQEINTKAGDFREDYLKDYLNKNKASIKQKAEKTISVPRVIISGTKVTVQSSTGIKEVKKNGTKVESPYTFDLSGTPNITVTDNNGNVFTFRYIGTDSAYVCTNKNISTGVDYNQLTIKYKQTSTKSSMHMDSIKYEVKDGTTSAELYDSKDKKFLKAYDESSKAQNNIGSTPGWLEEMIDEYDPNYTTIVMYLINSYYNKDTDELNLDEVLDLFEVSDFKSLTGASMGNGTGWWWPIGADSNGNPISVTISSKFGYRDLVGANGNFHEGIDIDVAKGANVIATKGGVVTAVVTGYGDGALNRSYMNKANYVIIKHDDGYISKYWHLSDVYVTVGQTVNQGEAIALSGNSGFTSGPHLHFAICDSAGNAVNPENYISASEPYPQAVGGLSADLYDMLIYFEGGKQYITETGDYKIFNNGVDANYELTCGIAVGYGYGKSSKTSYYPSIVPESKLNVGQIVLKDEYNQIFSAVCEAKAVYVNNACTKYGVTLSQNQWDAVFLFVYNMSNGQKTANGAIEAYKNGGAAAYYQYTKECSISLVYGRREKEYELFKNGTYIK